MKRLLIMLSVEIFISQFTYQFAHAKDDFGEGKSGQTNTVLQATLQDNEVVGIKIERTSIRPWWKGVGTNGKPEEARGLEQYATIQGVKARIHYTEFDSDEDAHRAAEFYSKNMASIFHPGLWNGSLNKSIGDESWYFSDVTTGLLVRSGRTCILISCREGDVEKRKQIAELLAKQIEQKIKKGGRVIVPGDSQNDLGSSPLNRDSASQPSTNSLTK